MKSRFVIVKAAKNVSAFDQGSGDMCKSAEGAFLVAKGQLLVNIGVVAFESIANSPLPYEESFMRSFFFDNRCVQQYSLPITHLLLHRLSVLATLHSHCLLSKCPCHDVVSMLFLYMNCFGDCLACPSR